MFDKINYMDEIKRIKMCLDSAYNNEDKIKLSLILKDLEMLVDDIAYYVNEYKDLSELEFLKQNSQFCLRNNDYDGYINNFKRMMHFERIALICYTQSPDEKRYFLEEYAKYQEEKEKQGYSKVR